jgi:hypothetical protein
MPDDDDWSRCRRHLRSYRGDWCPQCQDEAADLEDAVKYARGWNDAIKLAASLARFVNQGELAQAIETHDKSMKATDD